MTGIPRSRLLRAGMVAAFVAMVLGLAYLGLRGEPAAQPAPAEKLRFALPTLPQYALVHVAAVKGYFAEEGLEVSILPVSSGTTAMSDVVQGKADLAVGAEVPFVISVMKGNDLAMVASLTGISGSNSIIARRDHAIASARDLGGKRIGVTFATNGSYYLGAFLIRNKLSPESITLVNLPSDRLVEALASGSVDAVSTAQPISFEVRAALGENALSFTDAGAYKTITVAVGRREFLNGHANAIEKLVRAMLKAEQFIRSRPEESLKLAADWMKVDTDALRPAWKQCDFRVNLLQSQLISMEDEARWAMARGDAVTAPVPNFLPHLYLDALVAVQPERVTVLR